MNPGRHPPTLALVTAILFLGAGCDGGKSHAAASTTATSIAASSTRSIGVTALKEAVRTAVTDDLRLSIYVLWHNRVPSWATHSTRGPALAALGRAAATRRRQGIQIKNLTGHFTIVSITLAPSYATATAVVRDKRSVAPYEAGRRLGRAISGTDNSRIQLRRLGSAAHFVVWRVSPIS